MELLIASNPDRDSRLPFLLWLPIGGGLVFRTSGTWPRTRALYCHPVPVEEWPQAPEIVDRAAVRSCVRRGAAIDVVLDRARENRSQIVFTTARGRDVVFWQSPRTRRQARPNVRTPTAPAGGIRELEIIVDSHEQYPFRFASQQVRTVRRALPCGDYGLTVDGRLVASVERKSLPDLVASLISGKLRYAVAELAALPRAAVVVEDRYSAVFKLTRVRPAQMADGLAEIQIRWPAVPILFAETRQLAEEWTYRFLAAARLWADTEPAAIERLPPLNGTTATDLDRAPSAPDPSTAEVRAWARANGLTVPDRGRLAPDVWRRGDAPTLLRSGRGSLRLRSAPHATPEHVLRRHGPGDEGLETAATQLPASVPRAARRRWRGRSGFRCRHRSRGHSPRTGLTGAAPGFG